MQLTGKQCATGGLSGMEAADAAFEKSPKAQVRRPTRPEHVIAFEFLKIHYEEDTKAETPIQKSEVYSDYESYCTTNSYKPLVAADFGRILKSMFPNARDRRLGSRGSSKYCYVGVKRKSESNTKSASLNPYSAEDLANAYQNVVCEWASTVLSRRMVTLEELAKYLLRNRFVQTRSCAALTITASLKDTEELCEPVPMNKHRETQLKLQEKLREKLMIKQHGGKPAGADESELAQRIERAFNSANSTPDPDGQLRQAAMQICSNNSSLRTSPDQAGMSVASSACTSPVFGDQNRMPAYCMEYRNGYGSVSDGSVAAIHSQCQSQAGSERNTPSIALYGGGVSQLPQYQFDPRIQSCPATPLPSYQPPQRFDFNQSASACMQQCASLPNSARNTPVIDGHERQPYYSAGNSMVPYINNYGDQQRIEFGRNNSAFVPIKDDNELACGSHPGMAIMSEHYTSGKTGAIDFTSDNQQVQNDSTEIEINDILNIIENRDNELDATSTSAVTYDVCGEKARPMSAQAPFSPSSHGQNPAYRSQMAASSNSGSVIYDLLKASNPNTDRLKQKLRHHSGPQLGYSQQHSKANFLPLSQTNSKSVDIYSPPSTPNGNFRPVLTPSRELRMHYTDSGAYSQSPLPSGPLAIPQRVASTNAIVGTMSPPAQPLTKRKRNYSGDTVPAACGQKPAAVGGNQLERALAGGNEYVARRNLGVQLSSPNSADESNMEGNNICNFNQSD